MDFKIGGVLRAIRIQKGLKASYVAEKLDIDPSTLCKYESDERQVPVRLLPKFADVYNCEINNFFDKKIGESSTFRMKSNSA